MGKKNNVLNVYMNQPERIQSLLEYYTGEELPKDWALSCRDESTFFSWTDVKEKSSYRQRDILKKVETPEGLYYLGVENQDKINLIFPWRQMHMDCLMYERQIQQIKQNNGNHIERYGRNDDYLYRFKSGDRVAPVITLVLYWGKKAWRKPVGILDMAEMIAMPKGIRKMAEDYRIHLISMHEIPWDALQKMKSDLKYVLGLMKCGNSRKEYEEFILQNRENFSHIPKSAVDVLHTCMNIKELTRILEYHMTEVGEEETDMCRALEQIIEESREQGIEKGIEQERRSQIDSIMDKLKLTAGQAMELLGIPVAERSKYMGEMQ